MNIDEILKPVIEEATKKQEEYLLRRLKELGFDQSVAYEVPKRIEKKGFDDREGYYEYWLHPEEVLLFSEVIRMEFQDKGEFPDLYLVQHFDNDKILYVKPVFGK